MKKFNEDTITAIITPNGIGAVSVIRISGSKSFAATDSFFQGKVKISEAKSHTIHYGKIFTENEIIDDVLISVFRNPNSYTGEDSIEISFHGSPFIAQKITELILKNDVRLAEPGEFTRRAFLNGKIDLTQAEAVIDLINSRTEASLRGARNQLDGILSSKVEGLRQMLLNTSSLIELELDFAEEDIQFLSNNEIVKRIDEIISEIDLLLKTYKFGKVMKDGVNVALVGKPNVGKSSLLNYLLKESRAIVSEIPGTTRDVIREEVSIDGILFRLFDTAGIRITEDVIEKEGVSRSQKAIKESDLILLIGDATDEIQSNIDDEIVKSEDEKRIIKITNKIDLALNKSFNSDVLISAKTGEGIDNLIHLMKTRTLGNSNYSEMTAVVSNLRHFDALQKAKQNLESAVVSLQDQMSGEFVSVDLRNAENSLNEIIGKVTTDDILNNIFSQFCIGK